MQRLQCVPPFSECSGHHHLGIHCSLTETGRDLRHRRRCGTFILSLYVFFPQKYFDCFTFFILYLNHFQDILATWLPPSLLSLTNKQLKLLLESLVKALKQNRRHHLGDGERGDREWMWMCHVCDALRCKSWLKVYCATLALMCPGDWIVLTTTNIKLDLKKQKQKTCLGEKNEKLLMQFGVIFPLECDTIFFGCNFTPEGKTG